MDILSLETGALADLPADFGNPRGPGWRLVIAVMVATAVVTALSPPGDVLRTRRDVAAVRIHRP